MSVHSTNKWHALYVASRCERMVASQLVDMGIDSIVPVTKELRQWSDRSKWVEKVLFPNYVFLCIDIHVRHRVKELKHVVGYVKFGGEVAVLSEKEVYLIKNIGKLSNTVIIHHEKLGTGDEVEIIEGPLRFLRGYLTRTNGTTMVQLAIPSLHCFANVNLEIGKVRKVY